MSIESTISLQNNMSPVLESINKSLNYTISALSSVESTSKGAFNVSTIQKARQSLAQSSVELNKMEAATTELNNAHKKYNREVKASDSLLKTMVKRVLTVAGIGYGIRKFQQTADEISNINARLYSLAGSQEEARKLQDAIFKSAQKSRGEYMMTADIVSKLGMQAKNAFSNNEETIQFAENLNKLFTIFGTDASGIQSVMYNLTQAMATGVLRGQDLNAVMSNTPKLLEIVADYLKVDTGEIRKLAEEGKLTAGVVKSALLNATGEIDAEFQKMPMTFGQAAIMMKNNFIRQMEPAFNKFNEFINTETFKNFVDDASGLFGILAGAIAQGVEFGVRAFTFLYNSIDKVGVPLMGLIGIIALYNSIAAVTNFLEGANIAIKAVVAGETVALSGAQKLYALMTGQATFAQIGFNTALLASPIFIIPALLISVVAGIFMVVKAINHAKGTSISAVGIITGSVNWALNFILNLAIGILNSIIQYIWSMFVHPFVGIIEWVLNVANGGFNSFGDAVKNLIGNIIGWFLSLGQIVTNIIDAIFGTDWTGGLNKLKNNVMSWGTNEKTMQVSLNAPQIERRSLKDAYRAGRDYGRSKENEFKNLFSSGGAFSDLFSKKDPFNMDLSELGDNVGKISDNTKDIKDSVSWDNNNLTGLRDLMQSRAITELSKDVSLQITNNFTGDISSDVDVDDLAERTSQKIIRDYELAMNGGI